MCQLQEAAYSSIRREQQCPYCLGAGGCPNSHVMREADAGRIFYIYSTFRVSLANRCATWNPRPSPTKCTADCCADEGWSPLLATEHSGLSDYIRSAVSPVSQWDSHTTVCLITRKPPWNSTYPTQVCLEAVLIPDPGIRASLMKAKHLFCV